MSGNMRSEQTPLLQRVQIAAPRERYPHRTLRRFCTIALSSITLLILAIIFLCVLITGNLNPLGDDSASPGHSHAISPPHSTWPKSQGIDYGELEQILQDTPDAGKAREWSQYYTAGPHLAGKNLSQAEWTRDKWQAFGVKQSEVVSYDVYINYPVDHRLALLANGRVKFEARLEEDVLDEDPTSGLEDRIPTFHGYSASGDVTASYVFCNYGTYADFEDLQHAEVPLKGKIALMKYGGIFRGLMVKRAEDLGMVGAVIYSDPGDDGDITEENGHRPYPDGPARNPSSVQRGSVEYLSIAPGDPTTIGYPSKPGAPRQSVDGKIPRIPSLPISYADALPLLKALNGHGPNVTSFGKDWQTGGLAYKGVKYNIGPTPESLTINLMNKQEYKTTPLWNVIGIINGSISDEVVVIGNHRDAWVAGGAVDPNSGSAALNEVIRSFGTALARGWKPLRTVVFASWDGEEYGLVGSTEWVEEYVPWLSEAAVAYINVDVGAAGPVFDTAAAPLLNKVIEEVVGDVQSPNQTIGGQTVKDLWNGRISTIGSGSDFTAFQDFAGIPCLNVGFGPGPQNAVYHYHSNYDSFAWMNKYGDPGFLYHVAIAKIINLSAAKLIEEPILPLNATDYALGLGRYLDSVRILAATSAITQTASKDLFKSLEKAIDALESTARTFDAKAAELSTHLGTTNTPMNQAALSKLYKNVRSINTAYKYLERQFLYKDGLDSRSWFKHVVFAPGLWTGYAGATFPGLVEALEDANKTAVVKWINIIEQRVDGAIGLLEL